ncbi:MAG TPA: LPS assembly protein LptD, partial [Thermodesulfobacteriota bacterium]|nr:LPS assembly protein LptD [Thermodesulfobacteriota bacterium]
ARRGALVLRADRVELIADADVAHAAGDVLLVAGPDRLSAREVRINLADRTGVLEDGRLFIAQDHVTVRGARIAKTGETTYEVERGGFSSCICARGGPSWSITGRRIRVTVGGYAFVQWPAFRIKGIPVLALPYGIFPVRTERTSGLLLPRLSHSDRHGFGYEQPLFLTFGPSQDATISAKYMTRRGLAWLAEYRYAFSETTTGIWQGSFLRDRIEERDRGDLRVRHTQRLPGALDLRADINVVSDREFPVDFGDSLLITSLRELESRVVVDRVWPDTVVTGRASVFRRLDPASTRATQQLLPRLGLSVPVKRLETSPIFGAVEGSLTNFFRERGVRGQRLDLFPRLIVPLPLGPYATLTGQGGYRFTLYRTEEPEDFQDRHIPFAGVDLKTVLGRVYDVRVGALRRLYHTIEPEVAYSFIPTVDQTANPFFDRDDRIPRVSRITYAVSSRLFARFAQPAGPPEPPPAPADSAATPAEGAAAPALPPPPPVTRVLEPPRAQPPPVGPTGPAREVARLLVQQSYDFGGIEGTSEERLRVGDVPAPTEEPGRVRRPLSDLTARLELRPSERLLVDLETAYDLELRQTDLLGVRTELEDARGIRLGLDYRRLEPDVEQLNGDLRLRFGRALDLLSAARLSVRDNRLIETVYGLAYRSPCDCWALDVRLTDRIRPEETRVDVLLTLVGLGTFGTPRLGR